MKKIILTLTAILLLNILYCGGADDEKEGPVPVCNPPALEIENVSEYIIKRLYVHDTLDYSDSESVLIAPMDPADASTLIVNIPVADQDNRYITFVRNLTTTSETEIAVTTSWPVLFEECHKYSLLLLEEDFKLIVSDNYTFEKNLFPEQTDTCFPKSLQISGNRN